MKQRKISKTDYKYKREKSRLSCQHIPTRYLVYNKKKNSKLKKHDGDEHFNVTGTQSFTVRVKPDRIYHSIVNNIS